MRQLFLPAKWEEIFDDETRSCPSFCAAVRKGNLRGLSQSKQPNEIMSNLKNLRLIHSGICMPNTISSTHARSKFSISQLFQVPMITHDTVREGAAKLRRSSTSWLTTKILACHTCAVASQAFSRETRPSTVPTMYCSSRRSTQNYNERLVYVL